MYEFEYRRPASRSAAAAQSTADTRYLAGGQSLVQSMKLRLTQSERLVDLGGIADLQGITADRDSVTIGAMTTHAAVGASADVRRMIPALADLAGGIGDPMVRTMGTIGGSIANADPAACYPAAVLGLGAQVRTDRRTIEGDSFFKGLFETALEPGELIVDVRFPALHRAAYVKHKQPASRFALVGVFVSRGPGGVRVAVTGAKSCVFRAKPLEEALATSFTPEAAKAIRLRADDINSDLHASADYRAAMISVMAARAVAIAATR
ncbi:MAG TPA: xanthine dehydrogenase family protein subunit M [Ramlibacter sp.]|uniref:FAD binding domain-containing protein n=1 Tax=Ramlibacter sp. TaxID=1917967 RepID=UPI002D0754A4|nr:xanthine dehydrogenase family protein subunit M [Ramlibacter sp.]HVZ46521.1 xanthine dehydrogenase family protein subunit M [Ramlibacter sp.]